MVYELTRNEAWKVFHGDVEYYQRLGNVKVPLPRVTSEIKVAINERWKVTGISDTCSTQIPGVG